MPLYFNHVPKTAGTTLRHSLNRFFHRDLRDDTWFFSDYLKNSFCNLSRLEFVAGHFGAFPLRLHPRSLTAITFLRHPFQRAFSHFNHILKDKSHPLSGVLADMSFNEFIHSEFSERELLNFQCRFLGLDGLGEHFETLQCGLSRNRAIHYYRRRSFRLQALSNLRMHGFVGVTEHFDESAELLSKFLGAPIDISLPLNLNSVRSPAFPHLSASDESRLAWLNEFDLELYSLGRRLNQDLLEKLSGVSLSSAPLNPRYFSFHIDFIEPWVGGGWGSVESFSGSSFCWSHTLNPWIAFKCEEGVEHEFLARVAMYHECDNELIRVFANGISIDVSISRNLSPDGNFVFLFAKIAAGICSPNGLLNISFSIPRMVCPSRDCDGEDDRELGLYMNWARLMVCH
jgi:hypothetical protein